MPELSTAPLDTPVTGSDKLLTLEFKHIPVADLGPALSQYLDAAQIPFANSGFAADNVEDAIVEASGGGGGGSGTVTSVGLTMPAIFGVASSPVTTSGTIVVTFDDPGADRLMFWDDSASEVAYLTLGTNLSITGTTLNAAGGGSSFAPVVTDATTNLDADATNEGNYTRFTNAGAKTYTFDDAETFTVGDEYHGRNAGAGDLTITEAGGMTINPPAGGTLVIPEGGTFTVKIVAADEADLFGVTVAV